MQAAASPESTEFLQQLQPGQRLAGCYLLAKQIPGAPGRTIWLANDEVLGKDVALHFLPQELFGDPAVTDRLRQEVKRCRPLIHPHILRTYDFVEEDEWSAISTDAFEGPTLASRLEDGAREVAEIHPWIEQLCTTLDEAHRIRIVHGALTPHDITVDSGGVLKVMNFGISAVIRDIQRSRGSESLQHAFSYVSPEQLAGSKATPPDDIFSLGGVVHALLAGEPPFQGEDRKGAPPSIKAHRQALGHRGDPVPRSWERAVAAALATDPSARPLSAGRWMTQATTPSAEDETNPEPEPQAPVALAMPAPAWSPAAPEAQAAPETLAAELEAAPASGEIAPSQVRSESNTATPGPEAIPEITTEPASETTQSQTADLPTAPAPPEDLPVSQTKSEEPQLSAEVLPAAAASSSLDEPERTAPVRADVSPRVTEREGERTAEPEAVREAEASPKQENADARSPQEAAPDERPGRLGPRQRRFKPQTVDTDQERKVDVKQERIAAEGPQAGSEKRKPVPAVAPEDLAETVRREEAEAEARELGYSRYDDGEDDVYLGSQRKFSGARMAIPIVGAAVGLLILFGAVKMFMGSSDLSLKGKSDTATVESTPIPSDSGTSEGTKPTTPPGGDGAPAAEPSTRIDPSAGPAATNPPAEQPKPGSAPAAEETPQVKTAAEQREEAQQRARELEEKIAAEKKEIAEKAKALPQILKSADDGAAQQKKREDAAKKAEQAADLAERTATEKRRVADEARKAVTDLTEQITARRDEHAKAQEAVTSLKTSLAEDEKALAEANDAIAEATQREEAEQKKTAAAEPPPAPPAPAPAAASTSVDVPPPADRDDSEAAKARNNERKRIEEEMAALRKKLAEQAQKLGATLDSPRPPEPAPAAALATPVKETAKNPEPPLPTRETSAPAAPAPSTASEPAALGDIALNKFTPSKLTEDSEKTTDKPKPSKVGGEFMNSLGMKFVAVPGTEATFCIWPTRVRDFETFARNTGLKSTLWKDPGFKQGPDHPVVNVTWQEAVAFCKWLTMKEQKEGLLPADQAYRLPTDVEWSVGVGLSNEPGRTPEQRDMSIPEVYPWGNTWPPPSGAGNYTGEETGSDVAIKGYDDSFPWTSPVGSFPANQFGLFDMGGNVWEWCMDTWNSESKARVLRGASWYNGALKLSLLSSCRVHASPDSGTDNYGFRVVIAAEGGKSKR